VGTSRVEYLVSWVGYCAEENGWLGVDDLSLCTGKLKAYWAGIGKAASRRTAVRACVR
jgi:hypothetical protein